MLYFNLAWRNIWRNKRRTIITILSIVVAVFLASVMRSMQEGQYTDMIENTVGTFSGYIQIHADDYWDDKTLDNTLVATDSVYSKIQAEESVRAVVPRLESFALAAGQNQSRPAMVMGVDIEAERNLSDPEKRIQSGSYFGKNDERSVIIGTELMQRLDVQLGDSLVLIGQGFRGMSATGLYEVKGTIAFPNPQLNRNLVMMPIETAQYFLAAEDRLTALSIILDDTEQVDRTVSNLQSKFSDDYEVMSWETMMPELTQTIEADRGSGLIMIFILYIVVGFGILGTVLMMITERTYEFGVMISVGTPRLAITLMLGIEILLMALVGTAAGIVVSIPIAWYFNVNPIQFSGDIAAVYQSYGLEAVLQFSMEPVVFYSQAITVFIITLVFSLLPLIKASRLNPVEAMRS
ncbi:ABC transporter permease [Rhodohalobacter sulfatireducens]|uniref:ABC transporter permease n=1 Tax=Rhodohalobacter sulfatireducens TaxID=2911366 RepID=A0ABS9KFE2_9BACT|nr:ABC transporter permease [Rhodohalobacter sulfatireducens]MCG2589574.1 ABC transporter permease [Rhodohalobacter sulfatireducens]